MARQREILTDEQVELEIQELQRSPYVKLANKERRVRQRRRMYLYQLRHMERKGIELEASGITMEVLSNMDAEATENAEWGGVRDAEGVFDGGAEGG